MRVWGVVSIAFCGSRRGLSLTCASDLKIVAPKNLSKDECGNEMAHKYQMASTAILFLTIMLDLFQIQRLVKKRIDLRARNVTSKFLGPFARLCSTHPKYAFCLVRFQRPKPSGVFQ